MSKNYTKNFPRAGSRAVGTRKSILIDADYQASKLKNCTKRLRQSDRPRSGLRKTLSWQLIEWENKIFPQKSRNKFSGNFTPNTISSRGAREKRKNRSRLSTFSAFSRNHETRRKKKPQMFSAARKRRRKKFGRWNCAKNVINLIISGRTEGKVRSRGSNRAFH